MSAIIASLIAALGPVLVKFLVQWLESLFNKVAPVVEETGDVAADAETLVQVALDRTPRVRVFKRALLRSIKDRAGHIATGGKLSKADKAELAALGSKAKSE